MKLVTLTVTTATIAIIGFSGHSIGFKPASKSFSRQGKSQFIPVRKQNPLRMSTTTMTPDVSRFMSGDRPEGTKDYIMQQTMIRVKDPVKSLEFYCTVLGFKLVMYREFPQWGFNVYVRAQWTAYSQILHIDIFTDILFFVPTCVVCCSRG